MEQRKKNNEGMRNEMITKERLIRLRVLMISLTISTKRLTSSLSIYYFFSLGNGIKKSGKSWNDQTKTISSKTRY
jgi:hypothetical protein